MIWTNIGYYLEFIVYKLIIKTMCHTLMNEETKMRNC